MQVLAEYSGKQSISWPIQDMDCPHCAAEAMSALNRLGHVNTSLVSATDGTVTVDLDFEKGNLSEASAVLRSLEILQMFRSCKFQGSNQVLLQQDIQCR